VASFCGAAPAWGDELELAAVPLGTAPSTAEVVVVNEYDESLWINAIRFSGPDAVSFRASGCAQTTLFGGEECTVEFSFAPRRLGRHVATATVDTEYGDQAEIQLAGTATPSLTLTPSTLSFVESSYLTSQPRRGITTGPGQSRDVVIENVAGVPLELTARWFGLANGWRARTTGCTNATTPLPVGGKCTLTVSVSQTGLGGLPAELPIYVNNQPSTSIALTSEVPPPPPAPVPNPPSPSVSKQLARALKAALPGWRRASRRSLARRGFVLKGFSAPTSGDATVTVLGRRKLAEGARALPAGQHARIPVRFTQAARRLLKGSKPLRLRVIVKFRAYSDGRVSRAAVHLRV
jgi:hypothetical protein